MTVLTLGEQFNWMPNQTGILLSIYYIGFTLVTIPGGWLVDRFGYRKFVLTSLFVLILFSLFFSMSSSLITLAIMRMGVGFGHASYTTGTPKIISKHFEGEQCGSIQSKVLATSGIGGVLAFTIGIQLINTNWRAAYWLIAALYSVVWLMMFIFVKEKKEEASTAHPQKNVSMLDAWKEKNVLYIALGMVFTNLVAAGLLSWLPSVLKANFHVTSTTKIGYILTVNSILMALATMAAGILIQTIFKHKEKILIALSCLTASICLVWFILSTHFVLTLILLYIITILIMFAFTAYMVLPYSLVSKSIIGSSFAVINIGAFIGGIIAPLLIGNLVTASDGSFVTAYIAMSGCLVLASMIPMCIKHHKITES